MEDFELNLDEGEQGENIEQEFVDPDEESEVVGYEDEFENVDQDILELEQGIQELEEGEDEPGETPDDPTFPLDSSSPVQKETKKTRKPRKEKIEHSAAYFTAIKKLNAQRALNVKAEQELKKEREGEAPRILSKKEWRESKKGRVPNTGRYSKDVNGRLLNTEDLYRNLSFGGIIEARDLLPGQKHPIFITFEYLKKLGVTSEELKDLGITSENVEEIKKNIQKGKGKNVPEPNFEAIEQKEIESFIQEQSKITAKEARQRLLGFVESKNPDYSRRTHELFNTIDLYSVTCVGFRPSTLHVGFREKLTSNIQPPPESEKLDEFRIKYGLKRGDRIAYFTKNRIIDAIVIEVDVRWLGIVFENGNYFKIPRAFIFEPNSMTVSTPKRIFTTPSSLNQIKFKIGGYIYNINRSEVGKTNPSVGSQIKIQIKDDNLVMEGRIIDFVERFERFVGEEEFVKGENLSSFVSVVEITGEHHLIPYKDLIKDESLIPLMDLGNLQEEAKLEAVRIPTVEEVYDYPVTEKIKDVAVAYLSFLFENTKFFEKPMESKPVPIQQKTSFKDYSDREFEKWAYVKVYPFVASQFDIDEATREAEIYFKRQTPKTYVDDFFEENVLKTFNVESSSSTRKGGDAIVREDRLISRKKDIADFSGRFSQAELFPPANAPLKLKKKTWVKRGESDRSEHLERYGADEDEGEEFEEEFGREAKEDQINGLDILKYLKALNNLSVFQVVMLGSLTKLATTGLDIPKTQTEKEFIQSPWFSYERNILEILKSFGKTQKEFPTQTQQQFKTKIRNLSDEEIKNLPKDEVVKILIDVFGDLDKAYKFLLQRGIDIFSKLTAFDVLTILQNRQALINEKIKLEKERLKKERDITRENNKAILELKINEALENALKNPKKVVTEILVDVFGDIDEGHKFLIWRGIDIYPGIGARDLLSLFQERRKILDYNATIKKPKKFRSEKAKLTEEEKVVLEQKTQKALEQALKNPSLSEKQKEKVIKTEREKIKAVEKKQLEELRIVKLQKSEGEAFVLEQLKKKKSTLKNIVGSVKIYKKLVQIQQMDDVPDSLSIKSIQSISRKDPAYATFDVVEIVNALKTAPTFPEITKESDIILQQNPDLSKAQKKRVAEFEKAQKKKIVERKSNKDIPLDANAILLLKRLTTAEVVEVTEIKEREIVDISTLKGRALYDVLIEIATQYKITYESVDLIVASNKKKFIEMKFEQLLEDQKTRLLSSVKDVFGKVLFTREEFDLTEGATLRAIYKDYEDNFRTQEAPKITRNIKDMINGYASTIVGLRGNNVRSYLEYLAYPFIFLEGDIKEIAESQITLRPLSSGRSLYFTKKLMEGYYDLDFFATENSRTLIYLFPELVAKFPFLSNVIISRDVKLPEIAITINEKKESADIFSALLTRLDMLVDDIIVEIIQKTYYKVVDKPFRLDYVIDWTKYTMDLPSACYESTKSGFYHKRDKEGNLMYEGKNPVLEKIPQEDLLIRQEGDKFLCLSKKNTIQEFSKGNFINPYTQQSFDQEFIQDIKTRYKEQLDHPETVGSIDYYFTPLKTEEAPIEAVKKLVESKEITSETQIRQDLESSGGKILVIFFYSDPRSWNKEKQAIQQPQFLELENKRKPRKTFKFIITDVDQGTKEEEKKSSRAVSYSEKYIFKTMFYEQDIADKINEITDLNMVPFSVVLESGKIDGSALIFASVDELEEHIRSRLNEYQKTIAE